MGSFWAKRKLKIDVHIKISSFLGFHLKQRYTYTNVRNNHQKMIRMDDCKYSDEAFNRDDPQEKQIHIYRFITVRNTCLETRKNAKSFRSTRNNTVQRTRMIVTSICSTRNTSYYKSVMKGTSIHYNRQVLSQQQIKLCKFAALKKTCLKQRLHVLYISSTRNRTC